MTDPGITLPELYEAVLDEAKLDALFDDVAAIEGPLTITLKGDTRVHATSASVDLAYAREALAGGAVRGVQLRYVHDGVVWCDTLLRLRVGVRLVRVAIPGAISGGIERSGVKLK